MTTFLPVLFLIIVVGKYSIILIETEIRKLSRKIYNSIFGLIIFSPLRSTKGRIENILQKKKNMNDNRIVVSMASVALFVQSPPFPHF